MTRAFYKRLAIAAFVLAQGGAVACAATGDCSDLQMRLDALSRNGGATSDAYRSYDAQVSQQRAALDRASSDARAAGCYGGIFSPRPSASCPQMLAAINAQSSNLSRLTAARDQYRNDPYTQTNQRNDILRLMSLNRCGNYAAYSPPQPMGGFFASLFGINPFGNGYYSGGPSYAATYRTLCVRTRDGYYFPISFSTTPDRFNADEATCQAMCPGAAVALYVHHNPGEEVDAMVSLAGTSYSSLPTAFKYRTNYDASASCGAPTVTATDQLAAQAAAQTPGGLLTPVNFPGANATFTPLLTPPGTPVPIPTLRPAATEDPETLAGRAGRLVPMPTAPDQATVLAGVSSDGRPVRVVGPNFFVAR
jgi:hypothetical protein